MRRRILIGRVLLFLPFLHVVTQEVLQRLRQGRGSRPPGVQEYNRLKKLSHAPEPKDLDPQVTLATVLERSDDENRRDCSSAAEVTGYVHDVKAERVCQLSCERRHEGGQAYRARSGSREE